MKSLALALALTVTTIGRAPAPESAPVTTIGRAPAPESAPVTTVARTGAPENTIPVGSIANQENEYQKCASALEGRSAVHESRRKKRNAGGRR